MVPDAPNLRMPRYLKRVVSVLMEIPLDLAYYRLGMILKHKWDSEGSKHQIGDMEAS